MDLSLATIRGSTAYGKILGSAMVVMLLMACTCQYAFAGGGELQVEGVVLVVYQQADSSRAGGTETHGEEAGQLYLFGTLGSGSRTWNIEVRGGTTPRAGGVSSFYHSNGLIGETTDSHGNGRIAVTQLFYAASLGPGRIRTGLLDPTALFDANPVANDEYTQFLADAFINNPSIGFPSYVLGVAYQGRVNSHMEYKFFVGGDAGLEEGKHTYADVLHMGECRGGHHEGAFTVAELDWRHGGYMLGFGAWFDSGDVDRIYFNGPANRHGVFVLAGTKLGAGNLHASIGLANDRAQSAANFVSLAYRVPFRLPGRDSTFGFAVARTGASSRLPLDSRPIYQAEAYWRVNVADSFYVSPDIQYVRNPGFDSSTGGAIIGAVRVDVVF